MEFGYHLRNTPKIAITDKNDLNKDFRCLSAYQMKLTKYTMLDNTKHEYENWAYIRSHKMEDDIKTGLKVIRLRMGEVIKLGSGV